MGNQYNINVAGDDYFLDLLFYNTRLHCYVVFELKVGDFKPEYAGKLNFYINTVDDQLKTENDHLTIGVLLCKTPNKTVVEYALRGLDKPLGVANYELSKVLPEQFKSNLPTEEELAQELEKEIELPVSPLDEKIKNLKDKIALLDRDEIIEDRNDETIRRVVDQVFYPLNEQFIKKSRGVALYFKKEEVFYYVSSNGYSDKNKFEQEFSNNPKPDKLSLNYKFRGFRKTGTLAFDISLEVHINFENYKYSLAIGLKDNSVMEKLYHQSLTPKEINLLVEVMLENLVDDIDNNLNRLGI